MCFSSFTVELILPWMDHESGEEHNIDSLTPWTSQVICTPFQLNFIKYLYSETLPLLLKDTCINCKLQKT